MSHRAKVRIERGIGDFVVKGSPLFAIPSDSVDTEELTTALIAAVDIGRHRTLEQDVGFGIRQLVDIALRALSPGVNDTTTAIMCIDYLTAILARLAGRSMAESHISLADSGWLVNPRAPTFARLLSESFDQIREHGRTNFAVLERLMEAILIIGGMQIDSRRHRLLLEHVELLEETMVSLDSARDRARLRSMAGRNRAQLIFQ